MQNWERTKQKVDKNIKLSAYKCSTLQMDNEQECCIL